MDARLMMDPIEATFVPQAARAPLGGGLRQERLPFTVRAATTIEQLGKAVDIRHRAYGRHVPALAEQLQRPETQDLAPGCTVLLAESKLDGEPLGTLRIQTNHYAPLVLEGSASLPRTLADSSLAEATRLGVSLGRVGHLVRTTLFKAFYLYCTQAGIDWMVIGGRAPLDRMYSALLFDDVFPGQGPVPLKHAGNIPHRILKFEVATAEARWSEARHPLYDFVFRTHHADIDLGGAAEFERIVLPQEHRAALAA
jgi:hypothetical protein